MAVCGSACSRSSFNHRSTFSNVTAQTQRHCRNGTQLHTCIMAKPSCLFSLLRRYTLSSERQAIVQQRQTRQQHSFHPYQQCFSACIRCVSVFDVSECLTRLSDIVHQQGPDSTAIVCRRDCTIPFLACSVPNLCLDCFAVDLDATSRKFYADR